MIPEGPTLSAYCVDPGPSRAHESAAVAGGECTNYLLERAVMAGRSLVKKSPRTIPMWFFSSLVGNGSMYAVYEEKRSAAPE